MLQLNLSRDAWISVKGRPGKDRSGVIHQIAPTWVSAPEFQSIDTGRPDFDGTLAQFLIALLQTTLPPKDKREWRERLYEPPTAEELRAAFAPYSRAFELAGDGPRFMQDFDSSLDGFNPVHIAGLLIDTPGGKTTEENKDHFIKRDRVTALSLEAAAMALLCLQWNAPSGGAGHRTSLRGGGPLTTLLMPDPSSVELPDTLWQRLWLNVLPLRDSQFEALDPSSDADMQACFPWMGPTRSSEPKKGQATRPEDAHPLQVYWSMPRRIRLDFDALEDAECDLTGKTGPAVRRYHTRNYGPDYAGNWEHPLSPYYQDKQGQRLPTHPQPGGLGYRDWSSLTIKQGSDGEPLFAKVVHQLYRQRGLTAKTRLWAFGYDMDNMKARCWYDASVPVYPIEDSETRENLAAAVEEIIDATEQVAANLRGQLRKAWTKPGATASGDISFIADAFWQRSASDFYALLDDFVSLYMAEPQAADSEQEAALRRAWHKRIHWLSLNLFDAWAMAGDFAFADPIRISKARKALGRFNYKTAIKTALRYRKPEPTPQEDAA